MSNELIDHALDAFSAARPTIRVAPTKSREDGKTYYISCLISFDKPTHDKLRAAADADGRSVDKLLQRYLVRGLGDCLADDVEEQTAA
jgi:hypothetical protein